jgi:NADH:ubiquinone oxidoreductase subunit 6 (subunit J)
MKLVDLFTLLLGIGAVVTSSIVAFHPNILYAAISLTLTLISVAGFYVVLGADFLAAVQLIIYVGGIIVVILFAIMMSENIYRARFLDQARKYMAPIIFSSALFWVLFKLISKTQFSLVVDPVRGPISASVGVALTTLYALPFEYVALFLLVGLVGAVIVARPDYKEIHYTDEGSNK